jgi:hypothetical protein
MPGKVLMLSEGGMGAKNIYSLREGMTSGAFQRFSDLTCQVFLLCGWTKKAMKGQG